MRNLSGSIEIISCATNGPVGVLKWRILGTYLQSSLEDADTELTDRYGEGDDKAKSM